MSDSSRKSHGIGAAVDKLFRGIEILIAIFLGAMIFSIRAGAQSLAASS